MGRRLKVPADAFTLDATGKVITPGFVLARSSLGTVDSEARSSDAVTPGYSALDVIDLNDPGFVEARRHGITAVHIVPPGIAPVNGTGVVLKTGGTNFRKRIVRNPGSLNINLIAGRPGNEEPGLGGFSPEVASIIAIRSRFREAERRKSEAEAIENANRDQVRITSAHTEIMMKALNQEIPVMIAAQSPTEIERGLSLAEDFTLRPVFVGVASIGQLWSRFNSHYRHLIVHSALNLPPDPLIEPAPTDLISGLFQRNFRLQVVVDESGFEGSGAVRYNSFQAAILQRFGVDTETALKSLTVYPAEMLGLTDRVGTIEVGKDADLVIFNEGPLTTYAIPDFVIIDGNIISEGWR